MKELLLIIAGTLSREDHVEQLEAAIAEYKATQSEDAWRSISMHCIMVMMKNPIEANGDDMDATMKIMEDMRAHEDIMKTMKPGIQ